MIQPIETTVPWKTFDVPRPQVVVGGFAINQYGEFPVLFRTDKVRSAPNCWALPTGLHELGLTLSQQFANELEEELGLTVSPNTRSVNLGVYENMPGDGWHWVINMVAVSVAKSDIVNKEPDKHSDIRWVSINQFRELLGSVHPTLKEWVEANMEEIYKAVGILTLSSAYKEP